ncbi:hypothetical protein [Prosthecomicrobium sp. N25]|uniref:hypothetical protein n=1 Tax=Prosthecomicrobium sp. N25 TaxID=3129254 RepID=UPI0030770AA7
MLRDCVFTDFQHRHAELFGKHTVNLGHAFHTSPHFSDDALASLIDRLPRGSYHVNTMDPVTHDPRSRREGEIVGLSGREVIETVRQGRIWILIQNPGEVDPAYAGMLRDIYEELDERTGQKTYRHKMSILISSPKIQVYYHADVPGQTLWQVRGVKKVYAYPNSAPFLPQDRIEKIVLGEAHEVSLDYQPWFDDYAEVVDLEPGRMLHWPLNCPHRIVNHDCLNVSFTTEHWTDELRNAYLVNYANGILRRYVPGARLSQSTDGIAAMAKCGLAAAYKVTGLQKARKRPFTIDFRVDPTAPLGVRSIEAYALRK